MSIIPGIKIAITSIAMNKTRFLQLIFHDQATVNMHADEFCLECVQSDSEGVTLIVRKNGISDLVYDALRKSTEGTLARLVERESERQGRVQEFKRVDADYQLTLQFA